MPAPRTLIVDFENSASQVRRDMRKMADALDRLAGEDAIGYRCRIVELAVQGGHPVTGWSVDADRAIEQSTPSLVIIGPLYKMAEPRKGRVVGGAGGAHVARHRLAAAAYDLAFWIEHHMPKAQDGRRTDPVGSGLWKRWPEFGVRMDPPGRNNPPGPQVGPVPG